MARVEEAYEGAGVIHSDDCSVCEVDNPKVIQAHIMPVRRMKLVDKIIVGIVMLAVGFVVGVFITWQPLPFERIYEEFNHIRIHEDGSYEGENRDGLRVSGCIVGALCED